MPCPAKKRISGEEWPLDADTESSLCCYCVDVATKSRASEVAAAAEKMDGYVKRSQFFDMPAGRIRFYVYFRR